MIKIAEFLELFNQHRGDAIVVPGRADRFWTPISTRIPLDIPLGDPAMGGHASFSFGLAMSQPKRKVVLFDSEGDVLMSMGILATVAEHAPANFYHFLLDNECYATTGGQPVPNATKVAYDVIARGAGYPRAYAYIELKDIAANLARILSEPGPVFVALKVFPEIQNVPIGQRVRRRRPRDQIFQELRQELGLPA